MARSQKYESQRTSSYKMGKSKSLSRAMYNPVKPQPDVTGYWSFKGPCSNRKWIVVVIVKREEQFYSGNKPCSTMTGEWVLIKETQDATETKTTEESNQPASQNKSST